VVVSGHAEAAYRPILDALAPNSLTLVILMGLAERGGLSRVLIARGWTGATPAAVCLAAGTPRAWTWFGTLATLGAMAVSGDHGGAPGTIVIGEVVSVGAALAAALSPRALSQAASQAG
jgi:uroporphyrin-III C-methyltransferase/precorrin-2 dehydrogenase/sirohydrochlorin ferrochelatase